MSRRVYTPNRRSFLRGLGTAGLALPFLESLPERSAFAQSETPTFGFFMCNSCGVVQNKFWPSATGALTMESLQAEADSRACGLLADYADRLLIIEGVNYPGSGSGCAHAAGLAKCLTAADVSGGGKDVFPNAASCDVVIGEQLGTTPLTLYAGQKGGYIHEKLSFSAGGQTRAAEGNPYNVYLDLAGLLDASGQPTPMAGQLSLRRQSINDLVSEDLNSLLGNSRISYADKQRLQLHLDSIRDLENRMTDGGSSAACSGASLDMGALEAMQPSGSGFGGNDPSRANGSQEEVCKLQMELVALAFSCNVTRVATLQAGDGTDGTQYTIDGEQYERVHHISHRINGDGTSGSAIAGAEEKHARIDRLRVETLKHAIEKWSQYDTPNGPLLDNGFIYWTNHVADGPSHSFRNLPIIVVGNGGGYLKQGAYIDAGGASNAQVLNTLMTANGAPSENFGTGGTGLVAEMLANA